MKIPFFFESTLTGNDRKFNGVDLSNNSILYFENEDSKSYLPDFLQYNNILEVDDTFTEKYYYPIYISCHIFSDNFILRNENFIKIPDNVLNDIRNNRAKVLLVNIYEGYTLDEFDKIINEKFILPYKLNYNNFVTLTGNLLPYSNKNVPNIYFNSWENIFKYHAEETDHNPLEKSLKNLIAHKPKTYKFICLQRRPKQQRVALFTELLKQESGILTMGIGDDGNFDEIDNIEQSMVFDYPKSFRKYQKYQVRKMLPKEYDTELTINNPTHDENIEKYLDSYLHIVSETYFENNLDQMFFSEKIYKPVVFLQPFIIFGQTHSLQHLKKLGFKTFSPFINEEYDNIHNDHERFNAALKSVKSFLRNDHKTMHNMMKEMIPILIHNYYTLKDRNGSKIELTLLNELSRNLNVKS